MPRPIDLSLRLAVAQMARLGAKPPEIARQLGLPISTVRGLVRRVLQVQANQTLASAMAPSYGRCGRPPVPDPPLREAVLDLRRQHARWGATRIRVELARIAPDAVAPSDLEKIA